MDLQLLDMKPPQHHSQEHEPAIGLTASEYTNSLGLVKFKTFSHRSPNSSAGGSSIPVGDLAGPHGRRVSRGQLNALRHRDSRGQQQVSPTSQGAGETGAMGESGLGWPLEDDDQASPRFELTSTTLPLNNGVIKNHAAFDSRTLSCSRIMLLLTFRGIHLEQDSDAVHSPQGRRSHDLWQLPLPAERKYVE